MANELQTVERDEIAGTAEGDAPALTPLARVLALGPGRLAALGLVLLAFLAFFAFVLARSLEQPYTLLFGDLEPDDAREIIAKLDGGGVPYRLSADGAAILVPAERALRLRMDLAAEGLPAGGTVGYELLDKASPLTTTDFLSNVNLKRALEGELARTIAALRPVRSARVHIVQPKRELFARDRQHPTASIVLTLRGAAGLDGKQIQGIRHLVAAAVPGLEPGRVTVVDDRGTLLARAADERSLSLVGAEADELRAAYEARLKQKIVQLLERSVGPGRAEAEVTVEMDFDEVSTTAETYDPNGQVARSTQSVEERGDRKETEPGDNVSVTNNLPTERNPQGQGAGSSERSNRTEETVNYEISRQLRNETRRGGRVKRLSIAVQVDGNAATAADGTRTFEPRSREELDQLTALVRSAAGVDEERGDVVEVVSRPFVAARDAAPGDEPLLDLSPEDYRRAGELAVLALLTLAVLFFGVRPVLRRVFPEPSPAEPRIAAGGAAGGAATGRADAGAEGTAGGTALLADGTGRGDGTDQTAGSAGETLVSLRQVEGQVRASLLQEVAEIIDKHPDDAVRVVRGWLHGS